MLKRMVAATAGWLALTGMQAPAAPKPDAPLSLWRLDCGEDLKAKTIIQHEPADIARLPAFPKAAR